MLRAGGSAADAAIAVQLVLNLVEPQSSGLGGGAFVLHWDAAGKQLKTYDGRETAPAAAKPDRFLVNNRPMKFGDAIFGGASVGVPGALASARIPASSARTAPLAATVRTGHPACRGGFPRFAATALAAAVVRRGQLRAPAAALFLRPDRECASRGLPAAQPGVRRNAARHRRAGCGRVLRGTYRAGHRRGGRHRAQPSRRHHPCRPRRLQGQGARSALLCLSPEPHLRHGTAVVGWYRDRAGAEAGRGLRPGTRAGRRPQHPGDASHRRSREAGLRRPRSLHR